MTAERPSYVDKNGKSTDYAADVAERFNKLKKTQELMKDIAGNFPKKDDLNWKDSTNPYEVTSADKKGLLEILKIPLSNAKLEKIDFVRIAYANLFIQVKALSNANASDGKIYDINVLEPGDKVYVEAGKINIIRNDPKYADLSVDLYPWSGPTPTPAATTPSTPAPTPSKKPSPKPKTPETVPETPSEVDQYLNIIPDLNHLGSFEIRLDGGEASTAIPLRYFPGTTVGTTVVPPSLDGQQLAVGTTPERAKEMAHEILEAEQRLSKSTDKVEKISIKASDSKFYLWYESPDGSGANLGDIDMQDPSESERDKIVELLNARYKAAHPATPSVPAPTTPSATPATPETTPDTATVDAQLAALNALTDSKEIETKVKGILNLLAQEQGIETVKFWAYQPYDYTHLRTCLPQIVEGVRKAATDISIKPILKEIAIVLGGHGIVDDEDAGLTRSVGGDFVIVIDYDESVEAIAETIQTGAHRRLDDSATRMELNKINLETGSNFRLFDYSAGGDLNYDYQHIQDNLEKLKNASSLLQASTDETWKEKLKKQCIYLGENSWDHGQMDDGIHGDTIWIDYDESPEEIAADIQKYMMELYPNLPKPVVPSSTAPSATPTTSTPETTPEAAPETFPIVTLNGIEFHEGNPNGKANLAEGIYVWQEGTEQKIGWKFPDALTNYPTEANGDISYNRQGTTRLFQIKDGHIVFAGDLEGNDLRGEKRIPSTGVTEKGLFRKDGDHALIVGRRTFPNGKTESGEFDEKGKLKIISTPVDGLSFTNPTQTFYGKYSKFPTGKGMDQLFFIDGYQTWEADGKTQMNIYRDGKVLYVNLKEESTGVYTWHEPTDPEGVDRRVVLSDGQMKAYGIIQPDGETWMGYTLENGEKTKGTFNISDDEPAEKAPAGAPIAP